MSIPSIIGLGFGNGTYDPGVSKLPTLGYTIGEIVFDDANEIYRPGRVGRTEAYRGSYPGATAAYRPGAPSTSGLYRPDRQG